MVSSELNNENKTNRAYTIRKNIKEKMKNIMKEKNTCASSAARRVIRTLEYVIDENLSYTQDSTQDKKETYIGYAEHNKERKRHYWRVKNDYSNWMSNTVYKKKLCAPSVIPRAMSTPENAIGKNESVNIVQRSESNRPKRRRIHSEHNKHRKIHDLGEPKTIAHIICLQYGFWKTHTHNMSIL